MRIMDCHMGKETLMTWKRDFQRSLFIGIVMQELLE